MHKLVSDCDDLATALAEMETMYETQQALTGTTEVALHRVRLAAELKPKLQSKAAHTHICACLTCAPMCLCVCALILVLPS
jgi:hypothetical protein